MVAAVVAIDFLKFRDLRPGEVFIPVQTHGQETSVRFQKVSGGKAICLSTVVAQDRVKAAPYPLTATVKLAQ